MPELDRELTDTDDAAIAAAVAVPLLKGGRLVAGVAVLVVVGISYLMGRRKARSGRAVVEVYRI